MKKIIFILLLFVSSCCCYQNEDELTNIEVGEMYDYYFENDINDFYGMELNTISRINNWVRKNIKYVEDKQDYWKLPEETYQDKQGDCEDLCILIMYLVYEKLNIKLELVALTNPNHVIMYNPNSNTFFDHKGNNYLKPEELNIKWYCPYSEVIWMTYNYHDNVGQYR